MPAPDALPEPGSAAAVPPRHRRGLLLAVLAALPLLVYARSLGFGLLGIDDADYFLGNSLLHNGALAGLRDLWTRPFYNDYAPITQLTIWLDWALSHGTSLAVSRVQQLAWLGMGAMAVFQLVRRVGGRDGLAFTVALLYALHPVVAESALWLAERKNLVASALCWWSIERHLAWRQGAGRGALWASLLLCPLALLAKAHAVIIPAVIAAYEAVLGAGSWRGRLIAVLPSGATTAAFMLVCMLAIGLYQDGEPLGGSLVAAVLCDGAILARYLAHAVVPHHLALFYCVIEDPARWPELLGWWLLVLGTVAGSIALARQRRLALFCWLAAGLSLAPAINLKPLPLPMADHYLQWALPWLLLILVQHASDLLQAARPLAWRRPVWLVACGFALFLLLMSSARIPEFSSFEAVSRTGTRNQPDCAISWGDLCEFQLHKSAPDLAAAGQAGLTALACADERRIFVRSFFGCVVAGAIACGQRGGAQAAERLLAQAQPLLGAQLGPVARGMIALLGNHPEAALQVLAPLATPTLLAAARDLGARCRADGRQPWELQPTALGDGLGGGQGDGPGSEFAARKRRRLAFQARSTLADAYLRSGDLGEAFDLSALLLNQEPGNTAAIGLYREACRRLGLALAVEQVDRRVAAAGMRLPAPAELLPGLDMRFP